MKEISSADNENEFSYKENFKIWLRTQFKETSNAAGSYLRSIDLLSESFFSEGKINERSIFNIKDPIQINALYQETLAFQKDENSYLFRNTIPSYSKKGFYSASLNKYKQYLESLEKENMIGTDVKNFNAHSFYNDIMESGLILSPIIINRFATSLLTKPFVILTGLSGSGKTKLAQAFAEWICKSEKQYKIIPVGADWTNREPLLGYPNSLNPSNYVKPDNGVLDVLIDASNENNKHHPYFLILDEMNLSHVERYFADFLSIMESGKEIDLYSGDDRTFSEINKFVVPKSISWPKNLFIIGTVNIDETTYMFSPKVWDRANVIEFRITLMQIKEYLEMGLNLNLTHLKCKGVGMDRDFVRLANEQNGEDKQDKIHQPLMEFFEELKKMGSEFGYRSASEILRFVNISQILDPKWELDNIIDAAIMQKLLPKLHGSRSKLTSVLTSLALLCIHEKKDFEVKASLFEKYESLDFENDPRFKYPISLEKICRMYKNVINNGFTSYAEA